MMTKRAGLAAVMALAVACGGLAGCAAEPDDTHEGSGEDDITSPKQLGGSDMAAGSYSLTFDDGPGPRTEELANYLGDHDIVATFFINGKNAPGREAALAAIAARGHILANHTQNHEDMRGLESGPLYRAVADTDAFIAQYQPSGPWLLRAPYGAWDPRVSADLNATDMKKYVGSIFWNVGGELTATTGADWACWSKGVGVEDCAGRYMNEMRSKGRGVVLMHDTHSKTIDMTKQIVEALEGSVSFVSIVKAPQIAAAIGSQGGGHDNGDGLGPVGPDPICPSATLGRKVQVGTCVQRPDDGKWYRCDLAAPADWPEIDGPANLDCLACPQLANGKCR